MCISHSTHRMLCMVWRGSNCAATSTCSGTYLQEACEPNKGPAASTHLKIMTVKTLGLSNEALPLSPMHKVLGLVNGTDGDAAACFNKAVWCRFLF